jgi:hypothetical protein
MKVQLRIKVPQTEEQADLVEGTLPMYADCVKFVAQFMLFRSEMGDMTSNEVFKEFENNVTAILIGDDVDTTMPN